MKTDTAIEPLLYRRRDTSRALGCSVNSTINYERQGLLTPIRMGKRMVRHDASQVKQLAKKLIAGRCR